MANLWRVQTLVILILFASCSVQKRAANKVDWVNDKHPITLVRWCAGNVPVRADTVRIPGKQIIIPGTVIEVDCDTVISTEYKDRIVSIPCPPSTHTTDTFRVTAIDSAQVVLMSHVADSFKHQLILKEQVLSRANGAKNTFMCISIIAGVLVVVMGIIWGYTLKSKVI